MPDDIPDTRAASTITSSSSRTGRSVLPLAQAVAPRSSTMTEEPFWSNSDPVMILMAMLASITAYTTSGDVLHLAMSDALIICERHGLPPEHVAPVLNQFLRESRKLRAGNPFAF